MGPDLFGPERMAFGAQRLVLEILIADQEIRAYRRQWIARHRWMMYRERVVGWRYQLVRGKPVHNLARCPTCDRLVRYQYKYRSNCFSCGLRWWVKP